MHEGKCTQPKMVDHARIADLILRAQGDWVDRLERYAACASLRMIDKVKIRNLVRKALNQ